jgi:hypothetical protein
MTNFDPTTNRIPWYLLTPEEQEALHTWPHGLEQRYESSWGDFKDNYYSNKTVYRGKPAPKKITYYCNVYDNCLGGWCATAEVCKEYAMQDTLGILQIDIINDTPTFTFIPKDKTK